MTSPGEHDTFGAGGVASAGSVMAPHQVRPNINSHRGQYHHGGNTGSSCSTAASLFSKQSLVTLSIGVLFGFLLSPMMLTPHFQNNGAGAGAGAGGIANTHRSPSSSSYSSSSSSSYSSSLGFDHLDVPSRTMTTTATSAATATATATATESYHRLSRRLENEIEAEAKRTEEIDENRFPEMPAENEDSASASGVGEIPAAPVVAVAETRVVADAPPAAREETPMEVVAAPVAEEAAAAAVESEAASVEVMSVDGSEGSSGTTTTTVHSFQEEAGEAIASSAGAETTRTTTTHSSASDSSPSYHSSSSHSSHSSSSHSSPSSSSSSSAKSSSKSSSKFSSSTSSKSELEQTLIAQKDLLSKQSLPTQTTPVVMKTKYLPDHHRMKILITGGAGFVGSHLVDKLMKRGHEVIVVDNFFTGQKKNIAHWLQHPNFSLITHDVTEPITIEVDQIYHLACPASPPHYQYNPVKTIKTSTMGTLNMLGLAKRVGARVLLTSTSEIYGDPKEHPQRESYWGNVNTIGPRSCYDEGKRVAETMMYSYKNQNGVDVRVARIFNTFGPRMHPNDGRVVSNFIIQALQGKNITIYGDGKQTRSFQYVSDLVDGLVALMDHEYDLPVNLGNPDEFSVGKFASYIVNLTESSSRIIHLPKSQDDPSQRRPDISTAKRELGWEPKVSVEEGLYHTIEYFKSVLAQAGEIIPTGQKPAKPEA